MTVTNVSPLIPNEGFGGPFGGDGSSLEAGGERLSSSESCSASVLEQHSRKACQLAQRVKSRLKPAAGGRGKCLVHQPL